MADLLSRAGGVGDDDAGEVFGWAGGQEAAGDFGVVGAGHVKDERGIGGDGGPIQRRRCGEGIGVCGVIAAVAVAMGVTGAAAAVGIGAAAEIEAEAATGAAAGSEGVVAPSFSSSASILSCCVLSAARIGVLQPVICGCSVTKSILAARR